MKTSLHHKLHQISDRFEEISALLSDPDVQNNQQQFRSLSQEYAQLKPVVECYQAHQTTQNEISAAKELASDPDPEMQALAKEELKQAQSTESELEQQM